ncbi:7868_t:CDS:2, partial [Gigaspora margarita]
ISLEKYKNCDKYFVYSKYIECEHSKKFGDIDKYFIVSNNKLVSMPISEEKDEMKIVIKDDDDVSEIECIERIKVGIFNFETGEKLFLSLPHSEIIVETLAFLDENKLFMIRNITNWDIDTSKFEAYFLFDKSFYVDNMKLSDNGVLLFVYGKKRGNNNLYPCISVYFADHGNKFTTFIIDTVFLIASDIGARLLIVYHKSSKNNDTNFHFSICDPFAPYIPGESYVEADDLFKDFDVKFDNFENKYIIKNDKIVGFNHEGKLVIKRLIPDNDNWISYLRGTLNDFNSIFISSVSEKIIDLIRRTIDKSKETTYKATTKEETKVIKSKKTIEVLTTDIDKSKEKTGKTTFDIVNEYKYSKYFVIWTLKIQIVPEAYINSGKDIKKYVKECDCFDNDDLVIVTVRSVLIWTFNTKDYKIELKYRWDNEGDSWDWDRKSKKHMNNKLFLILYGQKLLEDIVKEDKDTWLRKLLDGCIEQIEKDDETLNTQIFKIFSRSISDIYKKIHHFLNILL